MGNPDHAEAPVRVVGNRRQPRLLQPDLHQHAQAEQRADPARQAIGAGIFIGGPQQTQAAPRRQPVQRAGQPAVPLHRRLAEQRNLDQHAARHQHREDGSRPQHPCQQQNQPRRCHAVGQPVPGIQVHPHGGDHAPPLPRTNRIALVQADRMQPRHERKRGRHREHPRTGTPGADRVGPRAHGVGDAASMLPNTCSHSARTWATSCAQVPAGTRAADCPSRRSLCWRARKSR